MNQRKRLIRVSVIIVLIGIFAYNAAAYVTWTQGFSDRPPETDGITVIAEQDMGVTGSPTALSAYSSNGSLLYRNDEYDDYFDVDPISGLDDTVLFIGTNQFSERCENRKICTKIDIVKVNLINGTEELLYSRVVPGKDNSRWHDVDLVRRDELLIAEIRYDRVRMVNLSTGTAEYSWWAQADFPLTGGGPFPDDWTHLNDVEYTETGQIMVSLRNQDQVVFLDPERGLLENMTLGADGDHTILHEQHNPDFIPPSRGGPAILVADSENDRVVEYQRVGGRWVQSWEVSRGLDWPRDADRLPNGHTLVTDTHNNRVIEIDREGEIVWMKKVYTPYEAERLPGDESVNGESAKTIGLTTVNYQSGFARDQEQSIEVIAKSYIPVKVVHALKATTPAWVGFEEFASWVLGGVLILYWFGLEYHWSKFEVLIQTPIRLRKD